jgi:radical SAM superfamily enzyme YgiQ (UPF0313 family)
MSNLAIHLLYQLWNNRDDIVCERVFAGSSPPLSLESGSPLDYFPVVAVSIAYELDYFGLAALLRGAQIPALAAERDASHPLIIGGGPALSANPEPVAPLLDAILIGEIEPVFDQLTGALLLVASSKEEALGALGRIPGVYLPGATPHGSEPPAVARLSNPDLDSSPVHTAIWTPNTEFANRGLIEIARGCGRGCRFCLAGYAYRPARQRSLESILHDADQMLRRSDSLGLVSAAVSDHRQIDELAAKLREMGAKISVSSMRVDPLSEPLVRALADSGTRTLTIAPEAGTERLRTVINKTQTEDHVLEAASLAAKLGFEQLKLYFMLGLPTEEQADLQGLVDLALACAARFPRNLTVNITPFVPKAHTPFQRLEQLPGKNIKRRLAFVQKRLRKHGIVVKSESPAWSEVQGALARGDRRLAPAILAVERLTPASWQKALSSTGLDLAELLAERSAGDRLPWSFIHFGLDPSYLEREAERAGTGSQQEPGPGQRE